MFTDNIPIDVLKKILSTAADEAMLNYTKAAELAGLTLSEDDLRLITMSASVTEAYIGSLIKQIDGYQAITQKNRG